MKKLIPILASITVANAISVFTDVGSTTLSSFTFDNSNTTATFDVTPPAAQNVNGYQDITAVLTLINLDSTDPNAGITITEPVGNNDGSFYLTTVGAVTGFDFELLYYRNGNLMELVGNSSNASTFGPMVHVNNASSVDIDVDLGILGLDGSLITDQDNYISLTGNAFGSVAGTQVAGSGIVEFDVAAGENANIQSFTNRAADQEDFHSGAYFSIETDGGTGTFAEGTSFNMSFDSNFVPEPSSVGLLSLSLFGLVGLRRRKS